MGDLKDTTLNNLRCCCWLGV